MKSDKFTFNWPLVGNEHIIEFLSRSISNDKVAGAYIFCGPDNLGKTTVANYFARSLVCENKAEHIEKWKYGRLYERDFNIHQEPVNPKKDINVVIDNYIGTSLSVTVLGNNLKEKKHLDFENKAPLKKPLSALKNTRLIVGGKIVFVCLINSQIPLEVYAEPVRNQVLTAILSSLTKANSGW